MELDLKKILTMKGMKTYLVAGVMIYMSLNPVMAGSMTMAEWFMNSGGGDEVFRALEGFGLGALRAGVTKSGK